MKTMTINPREGRCSGAATAIAKMVDDELRIGDPRSPEYRLGMIDLLQRRYNGLPFTGRYRPGTVQFDAYSSGVERGWALYRLRAKSGCVAGIACTCGGAGRRRLSRDLAPKAFMQAEEEKGKRS
jgi:hypothetical protein